MFARKTTVSMLSIFLFHQSNYLSLSECTPDKIIEPCICVLTIPLHTYLLYNDYNPESIYIEQQSIVCEHTHHSSFDVQSVFVRLTSYLNNSQMDFDSLLLFNTSVQSLPANVFHSITFKSLMFQGNDALTTIDPNALTSFKSSVEVFETLNSHLSDSETIFFILRQFENLRRVSMHNDRLTNIPDHAFNHTNLTDIWFGLETRRTSQPIESIGRYAFYDVPSVRLLRIFSPNLTQINKYAFAQHNRSLSSPALHIYLGGQLLNSTSFPPTSLSRFRNRAVFLRLYYSALTYLDEDIFQPFLETHPSSLVDITLTNTAFLCHCQSAWIQDDYLCGRNTIENRVCGYKCWSHDFSNCTLRE